jgi:hypothetical protein
VQVWGPVRDVPAPPVLAEPGYAAIADQRPLATADDQAPRAAVDALLIGATITDQAPLATISAQPYSQGV